MPKLRFAAASDVGRVRPNNEDRWSADPATGLFLVADGLGGHHAGELASFVVVEMLPRLIEAQSAGLADGDALAEHLLAAIRQLSHELRGHTSGQPGFDGMGATLVCLLIHDRHAIVAHLGDCRGYLFRAGELHQLTRDHTLVQLLVDRGEISPAEAAEHPARGRVTRYVGMPTQALPEVCRIELRQRDRFLLCSDGLTGMVEPDCIARILSDEPCLDACRDVLLRSALAAGGTDNVTALLVDVTSL
jgi:protein phosphatase